MPSRPASSAASAIESPWPSAPISRSASISTPSKCIDVVVDAVRPIFCSGSAAVSPGVSAGTRKQLIPREPSPVRASTV